MAKTLPDYVDETEAKIARKLIRTARAMGFEISINDGEEWTVAHSVKESEILPALASTDSDIVRIRKDGKKVGDIVLIWGNGEDLISDYSDNETTAALVNAVNA